MTNPKLKLVYFDFGGRVEATRLALFLGGLSFEDKRVEYEGFAVNGNPQQYPYAMLPVLEVDGVVLAESIAMARYAGRLAGLYPPNDPIGCLLIDEVLELVEIFTERNLRWEREPDAEQQKVLEHELTTTLFPSAFYEIDEKLQAMARHPTFAQADESTLFVHELVLRSLVKCIIRPDWEQFVPDQTKIQHWRKSIAKVENHPKVKLYYALEAAHEAAHKTPLTLTDADSTSSRGEPIRVALRLAGLNFADNRVAGVHSPVLTLADGREIARYFAILRYVGTHSALYPAGEDALLSFKIDELLGQLEDLHNLWYYPAYAVSDHTKQRALETLLLTTKIPSILKNLDRRVGSWAAPYATGTSLTVADLAIYGTLQQLQSGMFLGPIQTQPLTVSLDSYPNLLKIQAIVQSLPEAKV